MSFKLNPFTGKFDQINGYTTVYLSNDKTSYLTKNGNAIELWVNSQLSQSWEKDPPAVATGNPIGLLLSLTYTTT